MVAKEMLIEGLKESLRRDARHNIDKGTMKLPVDVEEFATRLGQFPFRRLLGKVGLGHSDYVQAIKDICEELSLEVKDELTEQA